MGSLEQIDPGVTVAPKAVLLQNTLLVHFPIFGHWERREKCFATDRSFLGMGKKVDVGLGSHHCRSARTLRHGGFPGFGVLDSITRDSIPKVPAPLLNRCYVTKGTERNPVNC